MFYREKAAHGGDTKKGDNKQKYEWLAKTN